MSANQQPVQRCAPLQLGRLALGFLLVALASGVALVPLYDASRARECMESIHAGIRWAWLLRGLHWWSALGLVLATLAHLVEVYWARTERRLKVGPWWRSVLLLPLLVMVMLSGFVLRGDAEAQAALQIWRGILTSVPPLGETLSRLLLGATAGALSTAALHHCASFSVLLWILAAEHGGRLWPDARALVLAAAVSAGLAGLVRIPLGPAAAPAETLLLGPWYMLGLQGALLHLPRFVGWAAPAALVLLLGLTWHLHGKRRLALLAALALAVLIYGGFTAMLLGA